MLVLLQSRIAVVADMEDLMLNNTEIIFLLFLKCALNCGCCYYAYKSIWQSIVGAFTVTLCVSDLLIFGIVFYSSSETSDISASTLCSVLQFFSGVYTRLHIPIFVLTAVDHNYSLQAYPCPISHKKRVGYWLAVVALWAAAIACTLQSTSILGLHFLIHNNSLIQVCPINGNDLLLVCSLVMMASSVLVVLSAWRSIPALVASMRRGSSNTADEPPSLQSNVFVSCKEPRKSPLLSLPTQAKVPFKLCIAANFLCNWSPFMLIGIVNFLMDIPVPAYISMNTFFLLCFNSFAIGVLYWRKADQLHSAAYFPDSICNWDDWRSMCTPRTHNPSLVPQLVESRAHSVPAKHIESVSSVRIIN